MVEPLNSVLCVLYVMLVNSDVAFIRFLLTVRLRTLISSRC